MNVNYYSNNKNISFVYPSQGYTLATPVTCVPPIDSEEFNTATAITWYFGDGEKQTVTLQENLSTVHTYMLPGMYEISAVAYTDTLDDRYPSTLVATASCKITNYVDNAIGFITIPPPTLPGFYTQYPYKILFTTTNITSPPQIDLYSQFCRSYPAQNPKNKWSFVRPEWRFIDLNGNEITSIAPSGTPVSVSGTVVGMSGVAEFYFVDDIYSIDFFVKSAPTPLIWATMQTSAINYYLDSDIKSGTAYGYSTTEIRAYAPHVSFWRLPDYLSITENGVSDFADQKWCDVSTPFFVSAQIDKTKVGRISAYNPDITFAKYLPYSVSAQGLDYADAAENIDVFTTASGSTTALFDISVNNNLGKYEFVQTDSTGFTAAGFARGIVKVYDESIVQLSATATVKFDKLHLPIDALIYSPYVWLPNPAAGCLSMIYYTGAINEDFSKTLKQTFTTNRAKNINTPIVNNINTTSAGLTGHNGMFAVAVSPGYEPDYEYYAWVADADLDKLYKYDSSTTILKTIDLKSLFNKDKITPSYISLDSNKNVWVTCYDALSVLKFDVNGNFLLAINPTIQLPQVSPNIPGMFDKTPTTSIFDDVNIIEPTGIDTDVQDNIWITYSNILSSHIMKYSSNGTHLLTINLPANSTPQDLVVNIDNTVWVSKSREIQAGVGELTKYSSNGTILSNYTNIPNISYITLDVEGNPWFTYDYNKIGKIKNNTFVPVATVTSSDSELNVPPLKKSNYVQLQALEGIACTHKNLIFVVHSIENKIYVYNASNDSLIDTINIYPHLTTGIYNDIDKNIQHSGKWNKSIQVIGDWTGVRWSRKYKTYRFNEFVLTGKSKLINFNKINRQEIRKINENFNMAEQLRSIAMPYIINSNKFLFEDFITSIYGTSEYIDDVGTVFYEKIANFLSNHKDIDTCEIDEVYNLSTLINVESDDYRLSFPAKLKHVMDVLSIPHEKLWGTVCRCDTSIPLEQTFNSSISCKFCGRYKTDIKGALLNPKTLILNTHTPVVIYDKSNNSYFIHHPASIRNNTSYSVNSLTASGFEFPVDINYEFYEYLPTSDSILANGIIDWNNKYTTLNPTISSYKEWSKNEGIVDNILSYYLYKGLNLI